MEFRCYSYGIMLFLASMGSPSLEKGVMLGVVPSSDNDTSLIQDAYISTICITPMHVII
jgi:hypothetical protein